MNLHQGYAHKGVTAKELFSRSQRRVIDDIVQDQIRLIDASIYTNHAAGFNHIIHELPINFNINGMDKADAQTMIYSEILMAYKNNYPDGKGFDRVYIEKCEPPKIHIYWINGMCDNERKTRIEYIKRCYLPSHITKN
jgi:hypothetical protein